MYILNNKQPAKIESITFTEMGMKESDIEEILRQNVDMICDDEESMLIVGQQVKNELRGRSDLTAIDNNGDLVLIEIKRDKADIVSRREAFEFQAIRYAASCATIKSDDELIQDVFAPYVEKHKSEFQTYAGLTTTEIAKRVLAEFLNANGITSGAFNTKQRIILVASEFDEQTLSAVAWLNSNQVDMSCYQICPYKIGDSICIDMKKILPVADYDDFYVAVAKKVGIQRDRKKDITRRALPKIDALMDWGIVKAGDVIQAKCADAEAVLQQDGAVKTETGEVLSMQQWLKGVYGWSSVQTYAFAVDKKTGKTLMTLREEYMSNQDNQ